MIRNTVQLVDGSNLAKIATRYKDIPNVLFEFALAFSVFSLFFLLTLLFHYSTICKCICVNELGNNRPSIYSGSSFVHILSLLRSYVTVKWSHIHTFYCISNRCSYWQKSNLSSHVVYYCLLPIRIGIRSDSRVSFWWKFFQLIQLLLTLSYKFIWQVE